MPFGENYKKEEPGNKKQEPNNQNQDLKLRKQEPTASIKIQATCYMPGFGPITGSDF